MNPTIDKLLENKQFDEIDTIDFTELSNTELQTVEQTANDLFSNKYPNEIEYSKIAEFAKNVRLQNEVNVLFEKQRLIEKEKVLKIPMNPILDNLLTTAQFKELIKIDFDQFSIDDLYALSERMSYIIIYIDPETPIYYDIQDKCQFYMDMKINEANGQYH